MQNHTDRLGVDRLHGYQRRMIEHIISNSNSGLFAEMGLGKSVAALTAADELLNDRLEIRRWLVIGTKKIAQSVWKQEGAKWDHLKHLRFSLILGTETQRKQALRAPADVFVINRDNVAWLVSYCQGKWPFDGVIVDESSSFKNPDSRRFKALKAVLPAVKKIVIMTGTPMPKNFLDLWSQVYLLDQGARLGKSFTQFRDAYFTRNPYSQFSFEPRPAVPGQPTPQDLISEKIKDICISLQAKDYLELPPLINRIVELEFSPENQKKYDDFERHEVLALGDENEITAINAAALTTKLLQFANGAVYDEYKKAHTIHDEKLDALCEIIEAANGQPVLTSYCFKHDLDRMCERFTKMKLNFRVLKTDQDVQDWNNGLIEVLIAHPASAGHGLNLQAGGNIIALFGLLWSLELYQQFIARLMRQGQDKPVIVHHLLIKGTRDFDALEVVQGRADAQDKMMKSLKASIEKHGKTIKRA